ncbi:ABC transporter permease [Microbacterium suaedae]|uniref:ABC transporter permease n=1 Tax=Microbacterium suaedae TaxID=2067813 RepID=UPI001E658507|nr:ABC transporter permease [Microbacterium suaedae]
MTAIDLSDYDVPGRGRGLADVVRWRYLLSVLVRKGTSTRYRNSALGWTWSYVKPLIQFFIYFAVMGFIFGMDRGVENFPLYLFAGFITVSFFNEAFGNATTAVVDNKALVQKIYLPRELFPISAIIGAFIHFLPQLAILVVVALIYGWIPSFAGVGAMLVALAYVGMVSLGLGLFFAGLNVRFRDSQNFVDVLRQLATWASPVLYTWELVRDKTPSWVPDWIFHVYMSNPITIAVEMFHFSFWRSTVTGDDWHGFPPHFGAYMAISAGLTLVFLIVGQLVFRRFERTFAQDL